MGWTEVGRIPDQAHNAAGTPSNPHDFHQPITA
jgi:hypothetical protein